LDHGSKRTWAKNLAKFWAKYLPIGYLPCHKGSIFKETKERIYVLIPMILSRIALVFFTTLKLQAVPNKIQK